MEERFWKDGVEYKLVPVKKEKKDKGSVYFDNAEKQ